MATPRREPADSKQFYLDFLPFEKRLVGRAGLRLFNIVYWHGALNRYIRDGKKHVVKYDPNDISRVYFLERDSTYLEIPYRNLSHIAASLSEVQNGARRLRAEGASPGDEQKLFQAIQKQRAVVEHATSKTLKARRQAQQQVTTRRFPEHSKQIKVERSLEPESPVDPFPFEIWHE